VILSSIFIGKLSAKLAIKEVIKENKIILSNVKGLRKLITKKQPKKLTKRNVMLPSNVFFLFHINLDLPFFPTNVAKPSANDKLIKQHPAIHNGNNIVVSMIIERYKISPVSFPDFLSFSSTIFLKKRLLSDINSRNNITRLNNPNKMVLLFIEYAITNMPTNVLANCLPNFLLISDFIISRKIIPIRIKGKISGSRFSIIFIVFSEALIYFY